MEKALDNFFEGLMRAIGDSIILSHLALLMVSVVLGAILGLFFVIIPIVICEQLYLATNLIAYLYLDPLASAKVIGACSGLILFAIFLGIRIKWNFELRELACLSTYESLTFLFVSIGIFLVTWWFAAAL